MVWTHEHCSVSWNYYTTSKAVNPFLTFLFPNLKNQKAKEYISTNIVANILGLGWAATPSGLKAMEELQKITLTKTPQQMKCVRS